MRAKGGKATLGELVGGASGMSLNNLNDILGEKMPELPKNRVGRYRLIRSLRNRFGDQYRNIPGVKNLLTEFDEEIRFQGVIDQMKKVGVKNGKSS